MILLSPERLAACTDTASNDSINEDTMTWATCLLDRIAYAFTRSG
ncbi:hypothetical protein BW686_22530 [Pseudomonas syringae]|uniref:Uncharacterized protein n=1 Tax=Pseudomonas syringae TaxID=317 RepID=A0A244EL96_PSESX|nr:hypothetical protein BW686_22530 [Pseudomonas syringae]